MPIRTPSSAEYSWPRKKISRANFWPTWRARYADPKPPSKEPTSASVCLNRASSALAMVRSQTTCRRVAATGGQARHDADDDLGHEPDQPLALEDVQAAELRLVDRLSGLPLGVLLTGNGPSEKNGKWAFCTGGDQRIRGRTGYQYADGGDR